MAKARSRATSPLTTSTSNAAKAFREWMGRTARAALLSLAIEVAPVPASRPRVSRWGVYYGKTYARWRKLAAPEAAKYAGPKVEGPVYVMIESVSERAKTSKREFPQGDVDNLAKGPLDIMTSSEKVWRDDDQIVGLAVFKRYALPGETPGTYVWWTPVKEGK